MYYELKLKEQEKIGEKKGKKIGKKIGEEKLGSLISILLKEGRTDDAKKVSADEAYREQLYLEYGIGDGE